MLLGDVEFANYKPEGIGRIAASQLRSNCKVETNRKVMFIKTSYDIRLVNEQILMTILISAKPKLKNPKWSNGSFIVILV
jgi:hypothetical protein